MVHLRTMNKLDEKSRKRPSLVYCRAGQVQTVSNQDGR